MGFFDDAPSAEDIKKKSAENNGGKYLSAGVHAMTAVGAEYFESKNGNMAINLLFQTPFTNKDNTPQIMRQQQYLLEKSSLGGDPAARLINPEAIKRLRERLVVLFNIDMKDRNVSTISEPHEFNKLKGGTLRIHDLITAIPEKQRQFAVTVDWGSLNAEGKAYLEIQWVNPIDQLESRSQAFVGKANPNPPKQQAATASEGGRFTQNPDEPDDLPF